MAFLVVIQELKSLSPHAALSAFGGPWERGWTLHVGGLEGPCLGVYHLDWRVTGQRLATGLRETGRGESAVFSGLRQGSQLVWSLLQRRKFLRIRNQRGWKKRPELDQTKGRGTCQEEAEGPCIIMPLMYGRAHGTKAPDSILILPKQKFPI